MSIEPDNEIQEGIDAEEAAAQEFADAAEPDEPEIDGEELHLLKILEETDRAIAREQDNKKRVAAEYAEEIKALENKRDGILTALSEYRLGQRDLPLE